MGVPLVWGTPAGSGESFNCWTVISFQGGGGGGKEELWGDSLPKQRKSGSYLTSVPCVSFKHGQRCGLCFQCFILRELGFENKFVLILYE